MICFRVTRNCNAFCRFCFAPQGGLQPEGDILRQRIDWLLTHGVGTIHFCGGEPTIHPCLIQLLKYVRDRGGKSQLTTNGLAVSDKLVEVLRETNTRVKVSLHGDREHHNGLVGLDGFQRTVNSIRRLLSAGVRTSVQTTVVADGMWVVDWVADFCLEMGVNRLSFLPFVARGACNENYFLSDTQRRTLKDMVKSKRRLLSGRLDVRWLDFTVKPYLVADSDGNVVLEGKTRNVLLEIPETKV